MRRLVVSRAPIDPGVFPSKGTELLESILVGGNVLG
jgi:hypothetical protein